MTISDLFELKTWVLPIAVAISEIRAWLRNRQRYAESPEFWIYVGHRNPEKPGPYLAARRCLTQEDFFWERAYYDGDGHWTPEEFHLGNQVFELPVEYWTEIPEVPAIRTTLQLDTCQITYVTAKDAIQ